VRFVICDDIEHGQMEARRLKTAALRLRWKALHQSIGNRKAGAS